MKLPLPSLSQRPMLEKFFRVLLGGLMASSVPRGRPLGARIITSGVENGAQRLPLAVMSTSQARRHRVLRSLTLDLWPSGGFSSPR